MSITEEWAARVVDWSDLQGHMPFLRNTAAGYDGPVIVEFGVRSGQSTSCFLAAIESAGGDLWSVDLEDPQVPDHWHRLPQWHFLKANDCSREAQDWLPAKCDILFVDTGHELAATLSELAIYIPRLRPGGVALFHDTEWEAPEKQLDGPTGDVAQALDMYCREHDLTWANRPGSYGMGIIRI